jgi:hypothetical protein
MTAKLPFNVDRPLPSCDDEQDSTIFFLFHQCDRHRLIWNLAMSCIMQVGNEA